MPGSWNPLKLLVPCYFGNVVTHRLITEYGDNLKDEILKKIEMGDQEAKI